MRDNYPPGMTHLPEDLKHPCPNCSVYVHQDDMYRCPLCGEFLLCPNCNYCMQCGGVVKEEE